MGSETYRTGGLTASIDGKPKRDTGMPNAYEPNPSDDRDCVAVGSGEVYRLLASAIEACDDVSGFPDVPRQTLTATRRAESALRQAAFVLAASARGKAAGSKR
jgi:hypothetical protein